MPQKPPQQSLNFGETSAKTDPQAPRRIAEDAWLLPLAALSASRPSFVALAKILEQSPWRHMQTPGGRKIRVAMTNCGQFGWTSDRQGYRYQGKDPQQDRPWPAMPKAFLGLAAELARKAGFPDFCPDSCLVNRYEAGLSMGLHQDRDEQDLTQPIVSVSFGLRARFCFGGATKSAPKIRVELGHGDVVVWGKSARLHYHGIERVYEDQAHELWGHARVNLTFRRAG